MVWAIIALIIFVLIFGWWGILIFAVLVAIFAAAMLKGKTTQSVIKPKTPTVNQPTTNSEIKCPACGSNQISANKKGFSIGQAVAGGIIGGAIGMNKIKITCLSCGHVFNPGKGL